MDIKNWTTRIKENSELFIALVIFWAIVILMLVNSLMLNEGHLIYALDDAYIHMAIAKNFSQHGVWGVTKNEFSSSSSSLLYSLLLSLIFLIFGPNEVAPLIINLIFANLLIIGVYYILKKKLCLPDYAILTCLILLIFFIPLHFLIFLGMEHTIQVFLNIVFFYIASTILSDNDIRKKGIFSSKDKGKLLSKNDKMLLILAPLVTMVRFEGMFLIILVSGLFLFRRKFIYALSIGLLGFLPVIIFGFISTFNGWYFLPNSILLKGSSPDLTSMASILDFLDIDNFIDNPHIIVFLCAAIFLFCFRYFKTKKVWNISSVMALIFIGVSILHILFVGAALKNQNFSRYDGYLVAMGIMLFFTTIKDGIPRSLTLAQLNTYYLDIRENVKTHLVQIIAVIIIILVLFISFVPRSLSLSRCTPRATNNIYEQQYQMGLFLEENYEGDCIFANDIGAINYLADIECLDVIGLGSKEFADARVENELNQEFVYKTARRMDCKIAIIYEDKDYGYEIPDEWTKAGEWSVKDDVVLGDDTVSFWAVDPAEFTDLVENLKDFSSRLPSAVEESGFYME